MHHVEVLDIQNSWPNRLISGDIFHLLALSQGLVVCQASVHLECISNLSSIPLASISLLALLELTLCKVENVMVEDLQRSCASALLIDLTESLNVESPNVEGLLLGERRIVDLVVDS